MEPLTLTLQIVMKILDLYALSIDGQPPDVRADMARIHLEFARMQLEDVKAWRAFFKPKP